MKRTNIASISLFCCSLIMAIIISGCSGKNRMETIQFATDNSPVADSVKIVKHFKKQSELFVLTHFGGYDTQMEWLNNYYIKATKEDSTIEKRMCSIFFTTGSSGLTYHCQNLDNPESGILIGSYAPPGKFKSIALTRMTDISYFPSSFEFDQLSEMQKTFLPFFAFYPADGINEHGLSVSIAGCYQHEVTEKKGRKGIYITYLNRLMLDNCKTVDEAVELSRKYYFFDHEGSVVSNHIMIADKGGNSAVIGYNSEGKMEYLIKKQASNVMTNHDVVGADTGQLANKCRRYKAIAAQLSGNKVNNYKDCMDILKKVENGTLWSVVMDNQNKTGYIAVRGQFKHFYRFSLN